MAVLGGLEIEYRTPEMAFSAAMLMMAGRDLMPV
jgi:hypothetical protein